MAERPQPSAPALDTVGLRWLRFRMPNGVEHTYRESDGEMNVETYEALESRLPSIGAKIIDQGTEPVTADSPVLDAVDRLRAKHERLRSAKFVDRDKESRDAQADEARRLSMHLTSKKADRARSRSRMLDALVENDEAVKTPERLKRDRAVAEVRAKHEVDEKGKSPPSPEDWQTIDVRPED